jgi:hypothetical protein
MATASGAPTIGNSGRRRRRLLRQRGVGSLTYACSGGGMAGQVEYIPEERVLDFGSLSPANYP